ncbi:hypothetical protein BH11PAT4_BH11PAT4_3660 [soil metagenome]
MGGIFWYTCGVEDDELEPEVIAEMLAELEEVVVALMVEPDQDLREIGIEAAVEETLEQFGQDSEWLAARIKDGIKDTQACKAIAKALAKMAKA